jgi:hypothetical protein
MSENNEFEVKPINVSDELFEKQFIEYSNKFAEYKKLEKLMKQYEANIKNHMIKNKIQTKQNEKLIVAIQPMTRNMLDRSLIDDIHKYYRETECKVMRKIVIAQKQ